MKKRTADSGWRIARSAQSRAASFFTNRQPLLHIGRANAAEHRDVCERSTANRFLLLAVVSGMLLASSTLAWAFPWDQDMVDQPSVKPQESPAPPPPNSVPTTGRETVPAPTTEKELFKAKDAAATLRNPVSASAESVARGEYLYQINCVVCHGEQGHGDGPVGRKFDPSPVDLNEDYTQSQADGQLFFTLTRGRVAMPFYRDALSQEERWDVINYLRREFGAKQ